jgi:glycosyltransferase involved in cell wall biosynthesis
MAALLVGCAHLLFLAIVSRRVRPPAYANPRLLFRDRIGAESADDGAAALDLPGPATRLRPHSTSRRYCIVTPCRDEAKYARRTLDAVTRQTETPALWVIVDDGSTDATPQILAEYAERFPYIQVIRRTDRGNRKVGGGVIDAFYTGYATVDPDEFEYVCKLDLDLDLPPRYFELMMDWMEAYPRIGTCSGKPYFFDPARGEFPVAFPLGDVPGLISEKIGDENAVGASKFYRTACFRQIGGFTREVMWDGIDGHRCRQLGWIAVSSDNSQLRYIHLRPMGTSHKNWWTGRVRHGFGQYFMGTTPIYMLASALYRMTRPPLIVGGVAMLYGYFNSMVKGAPRYGDADFRAFLRKYQWACLVKGKMKATVLLTERLAPHWRPGSARPTPVRPRRLGEILVQTYALAADKLEEALSAQRNSYAGMRLGEILLSMKAISEENLLRALAMQIRHNNGPMRPGTSCSQSSASI